MNSMNLQFAARMKVSVSPEVLANIEEKRKNRIINVPNTSNNCRVVVNEEDGNFITAVNSKTVEEDNRNLRYLSTVIDYLAGVNDELSAELHKAAGKAIASRDFYIPDAPFDNHLDITAPEF